MGILSSMSKKKDFSNIECLSSQKAASRIDTGFYALNGIVSGNVNEGIRDNTIVCLCGQSNSGKSFILANLVASAVKQGYEVLLFDSERAVNKDYYERLGCDTDKILRVPVGSTSEFRNQAFKIVEEFYAQGGPDAKLFLGLDSLGNLASDKELADVEKDKNASDQGNNAKMQNSAFRVISSLASKYDFPVVFTNHTYAPIGDMFATRGTISGGAKAIYNSNLILYFDRLVNKEQVEDLATGKNKKKMVGMNMKITSIKNRDYVEEQTVTLSLNYVAGINPYSGLLGFAAGAGILQKKAKGWLHVPTGKTVYEKDIYNGDIFNDEAIDKINEYLEKNNYATTSLADVFSAEGIQIGDTDGEEENS